MKRLSQILLIVLCIMILGGCGAKKLSAPYSEDKLKTASEEIAKDLGDEKYDEVIDKCTADVKKALPEDKLKSVWSNFGELGKYDSISKITYQEQNNLGVAIAIVNYEKGKVQLTLSFDKDMKLAGIYMK